MKSYTERDFWRLYHRLPSEARALARKAYGLFCSDPSHPSLNFKPLRGHEDVWSVRVSLSCRAVCVRSGDTVVWFWIGTHADFDREFG